VKIIFLDNGDNRCLVYIDNDNTKKEFMFNADFYIPKSNISNVMLGGKTFLISASGDLISLRSLNIKHIIRNSRPNIRDDDSNKSVQSCNCCGII